MSSRVPLSILLYSTPSMVMLGPLEHLSQQRRPVNSISPSRLFSSRKRWISWRFLALPRAKQELPMQTFIVDPILPPQSADSEWIKYIGNNLKRQQIVCCTEGKNFVSVLIKARKKTVNHLLYNQSETIILPIVTQGSSD